MNPEALEEVVEPLPDGSLRTGGIRFPVGDHEVVVHGDGEVVVSPGEE